MIKAMTVAQFAHKMKFKHRSSVYRMIKFNKLPNGVKAVVRLQRIEIHIDTKLFTWPKA